MMFVYYKYCVYFRHKETAPHKYMALDRRLRDDQRLAEYF